jgi:hypothetical protein
MMGLQAGQCYSRLGTSLICLRCIKSLGAVKMELSDEVSTASGSDRVIPDNLTGAWIEPGRYRSRY